VRDSTLELEVSRQITTATCKVGNLAPETDKLEQKKPRKLSRSKPSDFKMRKRTTKSKPTNRAASPDTLSKPVEAPPTHSDDTALSESKQTGFACKKCKLSFALSAQLGGHCARVHPGESKSYKLKMAVREARTPLRAALKLAKQLVKRSDFES